MSALGGRAEAHSAGWPHRFFFFFFLMAIPTAHESSHAIYFKKWFSKWSAWGKRYQQTLGAF